MSQAYRYEILKLLGQGGAGRVYLARRLGKGGFERDVAVKVLHPGHAHDQKLTSRLLHEARLLGSLNLKNVVHVYDLDQLGQQWAVIMEYVDGLDLHQLCLPHDRPGVAIPAGAALELVGQVAGALDRAWRTRSRKTGEELHILHRDVKPSNILLSLDGEATLTDFGIARSDSIARDLSDPTTSLWGSRGYVPAERFTEAREGLPQSDVFALGVVLAEILTAQRAPLFFVFSQDPGLFERDRLELRLRLQRVLGAPDPALLALVDEMLAYDPSDRPSAREVEETCRDLQRKIGGPSLRGWCEQALPPLLASRAYPPADEWVGRVLPEDLPLDEPRPATRPLEGEKPSGLSPDILDASPTFGDLNADALVGGDEPSSLLPRRETSGDEGAPGKTPSSRLHPAGGLGIVTLSTLVGALAWALSQRQPGDVTSEDATSPSVDATVQPLTEGSDVGDLPRFPELPTSGDSGRELDEPDAATPPTEPATTPHTPPRGAPPPPDGGAVPGDQGAPSDGRMPPQDDPPPSDGGAIPIDPEGAQPPTSPPAKGRVRLTGDAKTLTLNSDKHGPFTLTHGAGVDIPAGLYSVSVDFGAGPVSVGTIDVKAEGELRLECRNTRGCEEKQ